MSGGSRTEIMASSSTKVLETILVVDDTESVLNLVVEILKAAHFHVLHANSGSGAVALAASYSSKIDLLLSDVRMPEMSSPQLGDVLKRTRPDIHVMFMSGHTGGDLLVLNYEWAFINKPFVPKQLVETVNSALHSSNKSQGNHKFDTR
jgi:DNA-binding NtrC family response regulator